MSGAIYTGMSGMMAFSRALDVISNNVANLSTPGFKSATLQFQDLFYYHRVAGSNDQEIGSLEIGNGVVGRETIVRFRPGEMRETGEGTDVAVDGNGFFIINDDGRQLYTRAGRFEFNDEGILVSASSGAPVTGIDENGRLTQISVAGLGTSPPQATQTVTFTNNLSVGTLEYEARNVIVIDSLGGVNRLTVRFTNNSAELPRSWLIQVEAEDGTPIVDGGEIRYGGDGSPAEGFNTFSFEFAPNGAAPTTVTLDFGQPGTFAGTTSFSAGPNSTLRFQTQDGFEAGSLLDVSFNAEGVLEARYSNGQTRQGAALALGWFDNLQALEQLGGGLFQAPENAEVRIDRAGRGVMGDVLGGTIEISNVELTEQFTDLIIVQRGFQASSQVLTTANEMLQQVIQMSRGGS